MNCKSFDELKGIVRRNASRIMGAVERKYGRQECDFDMEFTFPSPDGTHYHCLLLVRDEVILSHAYAINGPVGIDLNREEPVIEDSEAVMAALADNVDLLCSDPDAFVCIDLTIPGGAYSAWDPDV